ncbi:DUF4350 domain-containing protein [Desulfofundulus thermosubterraneus]|uniref:DUF4350 domain-containing protein n=1 Tax=Desulfofundulus thermosubterraneus DSM 16057 TaxID=1121432 RepID=A0A1M6AN28_9FIRM|nr:DUF4350 domain-containing protein [Desulfofundulus thermosubterraneus]SHI37738.1 hypothetical protein SAMN02745219_00205 [Desulfofundulus thermosubterraneus DSM 16057]
MGLSRKPGWNEQDETKGVGSKGLMWRKVSQRLTESLAGNQGFCACAGQYLSLPAEKGCCHSVAEQFFRRLPAWRWLAAILTLVLLFCFSRVVFAAPPAATARSGPVKMNVELGWQGQVVPGNTGPAVVSLKNNSGRDISGVVEVINHYKHQPPPSPGSPPGTKPGPPIFIPASAFGEKVSLPAGAEKRVVLWFPWHGPGDKMIFRFLEGQKVLGSIEVNVPGTAGMISGPMAGAVGVLGQVPPALEKVRLTMPDGVPRAPQVIPLTADLFPRRGEDLNAFTTILVTGSGAGTLTEEQRRALAGWVELGGHLVLAGGLEINDTLAVLPSGTTTIKSEGITDRGNWQPAAAWLKQPSSVVTGAPVARLVGKGTWWGPAEGPLGLQEDYGSGRITVLTFDPNQEPFNHGALGRALWEKLLMARGREEYRFSPNSPMARLGNISHLPNNLPQTAFPRWWVVGICLLAYIVVAGPLIYLLLRRLQRPEFTWLAVPLLAVIFTGSLYIHMFQTGTGVLVNTVQVADAATGDRVKGYTAVGFFAPTRSTFTATLAGGDRSVQVQTFGGRPWEIYGPPTEPPYTVIRGNDLEVRFSDDSRWTMRTLAFHQDMAGAVVGLAAKLRVEGTRLIGTVKNGTSLHLDHVTLLLGQDYRGLGDLAPGQEAAVDMPIPGPPVYNPQGMPRPNLPTWQIFLQPEGRRDDKRGQALLLVPHSPEYQPPPRPLTVEEQRRAMMLEQWLNMYRYGPVENVGQPLTLVAWTHDPLQDVEVKNLRAKTHYLSMIFLRPELAIPRGAFDLPAGLVVPQPVDMQVQGVSGHNNLIGLDGGSITYAFRPGLPAGARVKGITVELPFFPTRSTPGMPKGSVGPPVSQPADVAPGALEVYHPGRGRWELLAGAKSFTLPEEYVRPGGEVLLRVNGESFSSGRGFYFLPPTVAYRGVME